MCSAGFGEPLTSRCAVRRLLSDRRDDFDVVHDNQCLGTGMIGMVTDGWPLLTTLHHPITVDRQLALSHTTRPWQRFTTRRWFGFLGMQVRVARSLPAVVTVSQNSRHDIAAQMGVHPERMTVVPVGVDHTVFRPYRRPSPGVGPHHGHLQQRRSHEGPGAAARGVGEAAHRARRRTRRDRPSHRGWPGGPGHRSARPRRVVHCVSGITDEELARLYGEAEVAVVPSLYEGFSLPAIEAMACGVPVVATTGRALPEVVGPTTARRGCSSRRTTPVRWRRASAACSTTALAGPPGRRRARASGAAFHLAGDGGRHGGLLRSAAWPGAHSRQPAAGSARRARCRRADRRLRPTRRWAAAIGCSTSGCGFGRHAFEAARRGASVVALDAGSGRGRRRCAPPSARWSTPASSTQTSRPERSRATPWPCPSPTAASTA